jgi:type I restriction enzyme M protein
MPESRPELEIVKELWEASVKLRGNVAPADYKHYVLPLLFMRYLSLRYERRHAELEKIFADESSEDFISDEQVRAEAMEDPDEYKSKGVYVIPEIARWDYLVAHAQDDDIKVKLDSAMEMLEKTYPELRGVLPRIFAGSNLDRHNVTDLINLFARDIFTGEAEKDTDILGRVYEYFISNFASTEGNRGGEYFTPSWIVKLLVAMLEPTEGIVFDPACGSGGMFVQAAQFTKSGKKLSFYGQERIDTTLRLCKMNLLMHGLQGDIRLGNSLLDDKHEGLKADYVIANPPFNVRGWKADTISTDDPRIQVGSKRLTPTDGNANYFWMMHFLHHLKEGGSAGFVMANGSMTTNTNEEKEARKALVEEGFVDCVVQLPDSLFLGTGIPVCLWFLSKTQNGIPSGGLYREDILFIDGRSLGEMVSRRQRILSAKDINRISSLYSMFRLGKYREDIPGLCSVKSIDIVKSNNFSLAPGLYVGVEEDEKDEFPAAERIDELKHELSELFEESTRLQKNILNSFKGLE